MIPALEGVAVRFPNGRMLDLPDFRCDAPVTLLKGWSGCGKSTALKLLAGFLSPKRGKVSRPRRCAYVTQQFTLLPEASVRDNIALACSLAGRPFDAERAGGLLESLGLAGYERAMPATLSCGQAQRAAIARALIVESPLLLMDEPTSGLDDKSTQRLIDALGRVPSGTRLVIATHDHRLDALPHSLVRFADPDAR